jgi:hypothetical protein
MRGFYCSGAGFEDAFQLLARRKVNREYPDQFFTRHENGHFDWQGDSAVFPHGVTYRLYDDGRRGNSSGIGKASWSSWLNDQLAVSASFGPGNARLGCLEN